MKPLIEIQQCEVCGNTELQSVLDLGLHPMCDDLVAVGEIRACIEYPIEIVYCPQCITAHQRYQIPKQTLFPTTYHYRSRFTKDVLNGMSSFADACESLLGNLHGNLVLDIGCNDASLLSFFQKKGAKTVGIEPTDAFRDGLDKGHELVNAFFTPETALLIRKKHGCPNIITFTNVFAHIENLPEVIKALKILMSPNTILAIENHYLGSVLTRHQFDTFYHEHPRTYSLSSFQRIAESLGTSLRGVEFSSRYGGNIRVYIGGPAENMNTERSYIDSVLKTETLFGDRLQKMQNEVEMWKAMMYRRIHSLVEKHGKLVGKAFPGRASILVKLLDLNTDVIECVYEKAGSMKIGHYLPGTLIPIRSDDELLAQKSKPPVILNFAWHISKEINVYLRNQGYTGEIIDILDPCEFSSPSN